MIAAGRRRALAAAGVDGSWHIGALRQGTAAAATFPVGGTDSERIFHHSAEKTPAHSSPPSTTLIAN